VNGRLSRLAGFFVAPVEAAPAFAPPRARQASAGVLAAEDDLLVAAGATAAGLRREARASCALVCVWRGHDQRPLASLAPAAPGAGRLASKLARRELAARGSGTVCVVELPPDPEAAAAAARAALAAADVPAVLAVARREPALDRLLASLDRVVLALAGQDPTLAELALADLATLGRPVEQLVLPGAFVARQAARLGFAPAHEPAPPRAAAHPAPARSTT
jgi:hypothetical protein